MKQKIKPDAYRSGNKWEENKEDTQSLNMFTNSHPASIIPASVVSEVYAVLTAGTGAKPLFRPQCTFIDLYKLWETSAIPLYPTIYPNAIHCLLLFSTLILTSSAFTDATASSFSLIASSWESLATDSLASISLDRPIN